MNRTPSEMKEQGKTIFKKNKNELEHKKHLSLTINYSILMWQSKMLS